MRSLMKWTVLVVALAAPVAVAVFLKLFGRNQYDVPPLFTDSLPPIPAHCLNNPTVPYSIPEKIRIRLGLQGNAPLFLLYTGPADSVELQRLQHTFTEEEVRVVILSASKALPADSLEFYKACYLFVKEQNVKILVDSIGQIRGYYGSLREETDKLLMEASIILRKY
jgi:hypothetical protein